MATLTARVYQALLGPEGIIEHRCDADSVLPYAPAMKGLILSGGRGTPSARGDVELT
ncbi:MAG: hypothetical protein JWM18_178 [Chloroflexi bacterium]|jgi:hypothetical protein|nr:hypothetical protein [Chloroflexota bacterium]MDB5113042.1 hypothetical protein [Chloroflexota bacterium]MEA2618548.1 hypothetical protein [Chloroflexota bacterium]